MENEYFLLSYDFKQVLCLLLNLWIFLVIMMFNPWQCCFQSTLTRKILFVTLELYTNQNLLYILFISHFTFQMIVNQIKIVLPCIFINIIQRSFEHITSL